MCLAPLPAANGRRNPGRLLLLCEGSECLPADAVAAFAAMEKLHPQELKTVVSSDTET